MACMIVKLLSKFGAFSPGAVNPRVQSPKLSKIAFITRLS
jgi:hypothetical protein